MDQKIVISKPVFYQETSFSTLYQLLSYEPGLEAWHVQNVVMGCESPMIINIDMTRISHNIKRFNTAQSDNNLVEAVEASEAMEYLNGLGIDTFKLLSEFSRDKDVANWSELGSVMSHTEQVKREPALV